jgi:hypothetical protein
MKTLRSLVLVLVMLVPALVTAEPLPPRATMVPRWRELSRRVSPVFVSARNHVGHKATGLLLKITLWRF